MTGGPLAHPALRIVVCGNPDRGDDGVAEVTVSTLPSELLSTLEVRHAVALRVEDLVDLPWSARCLIVDAVAGVEPGTIVRRDLAELADRAGFTPRSSHELPIHLVVGLAGILRDAPIEGTFVGLGGAGFDIGTRLSRTACAALPAFREAILEAAYDLAFHLARTPVATAPEGVA